MCFVAVLVSAHCVCSIVVIAMDMAYTIAQYVRSRMLADYSHVCYCFFRVIVLVVVVVVCVFGDNVEMALYDKF